MENSGLIKEEQGYLEENLGLVDSEIKVSKNILDNYVNGDISAYKKIDENEYNNAIRKNLELEKIKKGPYYGKLNLTYTGDEKAESIYIGKKDLIVDNEVIIASWASPIADVYQGNSVGDFNHKSESESGKVLILDGKILEKRKIDIQSGKVRNVVKTGNKDSAKEKKAEEDFIKEKINSSDSGKLNTIIETIQEDQNEIIRLPIEKNILVQGCAGSGKSSVAFHRLAYLMYKHKLDEDDVLVISPNKIFKSYTDNLVLELGNDFVVKNLLFTEFAKEILKKDYAYFNNKINRVKENVYKIKTSENYKKLLDKYSTYLLENYLEKTNIEFDDDIIVNYEEIQDIWLNKFAMYNLNERVAKFKTYIKSYLGIKTNTYIEEQMQIYERNSVKIKREIKNKKKCDDLLALNKSEKQIKKERASLYLPELLKIYLDKLKNIEMQDAYSNLSTNKDLVKKLAVGCMRDYEITILLNSMDNGSIDEIDSICAFYLYTRLFNVKNKYRHIIIDECQDLSYLEVAIIENITRSFSIVGDFNQSVSLYKNSITLEDIDNMFSSYTYFEKYILNKSFRNAKEITEFSNAIMMPYFIDKNSIPEAFNRSCEKPILYTMKTNTQIRMKLVELIKENRDNNLAIIIKDENEINDLYRNIKSRLVNIKVNLITNDDDKYIAGINIISARLSKGLEFGKVIILNAEQYKDNKPDRSLLYIGATRALNNLTIMMLEEDSFIKDIDKNLWKEIIRFTPDSMCEVIKDTIIESFEKKAKVIPMEVIDYLDAIGEANKLLEIITYLNSIEDINMFYEKYGIKINTGLIYEAKKNLDDLIDEKTKKNNLEDKDDSSSKYTKYKENIMETLRLKRKFMPLKQEIVAEYISSNFEELTLIKSAAELGKIVDVSGSTVNTVLMKLGVGTYKNFVDEIMKCKK